MSVEIDPSQPAHIHVIGAGGAGMSAIALVLAQMGHEVSGSDLHRSTTTDQLARAGVRIDIGHDAKHVEGASWVTASPAVPDSNSELVAARQQGIPVHGRATVMGALTKRRRTLAVAGTHGKTTTSSMLTLIALEAGAAPSFVIGAPINGLGVNAHWGEGDLLVIEADESYGSFSRLEPALTGITNIEADHLDHYGTVEDLEAAFLALLSRSTAGGIVYADDAGAARVGAAAHAATVGSSPSSEMMIHSVSLGRSTSSFILRWKGEDLVIKVGAPGRHNVANAAIAAALALEAGLDPAAVVAGLARFVGVPRRFEFRGEAGGVTFVDDYAHLPAEVAATLSAATAGGFDRIIAVFQPHRYTRTQAVASGFAGAFDGADLVFVTDIYSAGETPLPGVTGRLVAEAAQQGRPEGSVVYVGTLDEAAMAVRDVLLPGDLCLTMGAGDLTDLPDQLIAARR